MDNELLIKGLEIYKQQYLDNEDKTTDLVWTFNQTAINEMATTEIGEQNHRNEHTSKSQCFSKTLCIVTENSP